MHFSDSEDETPEDGSSNKKLCIELRTGAKRLRMSVNLASTDDEDEEWENWLFEDIAVKVGACPRSYWVHKMYSRRDSDGEFWRVCIPYRDYPDKFYKYFRMSVTTFDYVLESIRTR